MWTCKLRSSGFALHQVIPQLPSRYFQFVRPQWIAVVLTGVYEVSILSFALSAGFIVWPSLIVGFSSVQLVAACRKQCGTSLE
jgi:hypothetical protein